jgi:IS30 family transposase
LYQQITLQERYMIGQFRRDQISIRQIAHKLGRSPSTISRELRRNRRKGGFWGVTAAQEKTNARRSRSRRHSYFDAEIRSLIFSKIGQEWAPEQVAGWLKRNQGPSIAAKTIYRWIRKDRNAGGDLYKHLRQARKRWRKLYRSRDSRGKLPGKRHISQRPKESAERLTYGHFELDLVLGKVTKHCALTLVDRKTRYTVIRKLANKTTEEVNRVLIPLISEYGIKTLTADNGCEFHGFKRVEAETNVRFYFATPHHSWERGTSENTNGLIRQYLPKGMTMEHISEEYLDFVQSRLNNRPREILGMRTPWEVASAYSLGVALDESDRPAGDKGSVSAHFDQSNFPTRFESAPRPPFSNFLSDLLSDLLFSPKAYMPFELIRFSLQIARPG